MHWDLKVSLQEVQLQEGLGGVEFLNEVYHAGQSVMVWAGHKVEVVVVAKGLQEMPDFFTM